MHLDVSETVCTKLLEKLVKEKIWRIIENIMLFSSLSKHVKRDSIPFLKAVENSTSEKFIEFLIDKKFSLNEDLEGSIVAALRKDWFKVGFKLLSFCQEVLSSTYSPLQKCVELVIKTGT